MGVHDLWRLLAPCGHRLSLTTLSRRRLAIDVSIWIQQFVKALPTSQPHLLGLLRRLCKLHFYHIYPVCVFDGPAPALKKRTLDQRRHLREKQRESFERVAERLVLEQLRMKSVAQLRRELAKKKKEAQAAKEEKIAAEDDDVQLIDSSPTPSPASSKASKHRRRPSPPADEAALLRVIDEADEDPELRLLRQLQDEEDARGSLDLVAQWQTQDDEALQSSPTSVSPSPPPLRPPPLERLTAEERELGRSAAQLSDEEESPELIPVPEVLDPLSYQLPASGDLDSGVLAALPISLQYSLLEQHRSHHHTLSMRRYAAVKGDMSAFSAMQMGAFLKQVEFNKTIDRKRMEMNSGEELDGYKVRRLAGDGSREFIYHKRDERAEAAAERVKAEDAEAQRRENGRLQREAESGARYIHSHLSRVRQREQQQWRCDDCGHHNSVRDPAAPAICDLCAAPRTLRPVDGGTVNLLVGSGPGDREGPAVKREQAKEEVKEPTRVASFYGKAGGASADRKGAGGSGLYWTCPQCQYLNPFGHPHCEICGRQRDPTAEPVVVDLTGDAPASHPAARRPSYAEVIHVPEDEEEQPRRRPSGGAAEKEGPLEISFDTEGKVAGDEDVFPEDFFSAFEDPASAPLPPLPSLQFTASPPGAQPSTGSPSKGSPPPPADSLLLPRASLREAEKLRRPRMRLKKLDVKEIIWFDDDDVGARAPEQSKQKAAGPRPPPLPPTPLPVAEQPHWDDEVEEVFVRGRAKLVKKADPTYLPPSMVPPPPTQLDSGFFEAEEEPQLSMDEGKYDNDEGGEQREEEVEEEDGDARQQLKQAIAMSISFAVNRHEQQHADVTLMDDVESAKRPVVLKRRGAAPKEPKEAKEPREVLDSIAEEEEEMKAELQAQRRMEDTDEVVLADETLRPAADGQPIVTERTVITLDSEAARLEEDGGAQVTLTVEATTTAEAPVPAPAPSSASTDESTPSSSPSVPPAPQPAADAPSSIVSPPPAKAQGFVLPSLSSLTSAVPAKSTNLFFAERLQRQQAAEETQSSPPPPARPSPAQPTASPPPAPSVQAPTRAVSTSGSSSSPSAAPEALATWSSASDVAVEGSRDHQLSELYTESHIQSSTLARQKAKQARQTQQVTPQMLDECRHLLALFGCPYIVSPAEAEAQCATLETLGLVDGVVTEDSDVFLFGARHVYRNIFEQKKYAERYRVEEVDAVLGLDREDLISLALLLGSDYTEGVHGVGIVNAMEIVNAFPGEGNAGLREFREWVYSGSVEKRPRVPELKEGVEGETVEAKAERERANAALVQAYRKALFKFKHRNIRTSWHVTRDFPSDAVRRGYEQPNVDRSEEELSWSVPRWDDIIAFLREQFKEEEEQRRREGRLEREEEEWIQMVLTLRQAWEAEEAKAATNVGYQPQLDLYFRPDDKFAEVKSRRINSAIAGLTRQRGDVEREVSHEEEEEARRKVKPKRPRKKKTDPPVAQSPADGGDDKENEALASPATAASNESPQGAGKAAKGRGRGRGRGGGRAAGRGGVMGNEVAERLREARAEKAREDAEWIDDNVMLWQDEDDGGDDDGGGQPVRGGRGRGRGSGRGRGGRGQGSDVKRGRVS